MPAKILLLATVGLLACGSAPKAAGETPQPSQASVDFVMGDSRLAVVIDGMPVAVYWYKTEQITRPFFSHVHTSSGIQVTRDHPPIAGHDLVDHDTMHPGVWMSFGDISASDYWRNKAAVKHVEFVERPQAGPGTGRFTVRNQYLEQADPSHVVCEEIARYTFLVRPEGYLILWDSRFSSDDEFAFGDQEEMGLGLRVTTPLRVGAAGAGKLAPGSGAITNSEGGKNEDEVWGNAADWCDYSGTLAGQQVGITIFCHPDNFRPSRFHARGYGLLVANPFGQKAFEKGQKSSVVVRPGEELHLRYGLLIHHRPQGTQPNLAAAYQDYLRSAEK